jgi:hypothetical protein
MFPHQPLSVGKPDLELSGQLAEGCSFPIARDEELYVVWSQPITDTPHGRSMLARHTQPFVWLVSLGWRKPEQDSRQIIG